MFQKEPCLWDPVPLLLLLPLHWGLRPQESKSQALSLTAGTLIFPTEGPPTTLTTSEGDRGRGGLVGSCRPATARIYSVTLSGACPILVPETLLVLPLCASSIVCMRRQMGTREGARRPERIPGFLNQQRGRGGRLQCPQVWCGVLSLSPT